MIKAMQAVVTQTSRIQKGNMFWEIWERGKKKLNEERNWNGKEIPASIASITSYTKNISYDTQEEKQYQENKYLVYSQSLWEGNDECIASWSNFKWSIQLE